ncbi:MAG: hypothetical protein GY821_14720, partial [Gammaproteobacteria bacterium]|nr:hypothetical protein [Gammaproteobacteria bacterium]
IGNLEVKFRELMKSLVPWPFRQTGRLKICAYCGLRASAFGFPWPAAVARTIADLSNEKEIAAEHLYEAASYRQITI